MSESRLCEVIAVIPRPSGRTVITILCAYCGCAVEARTWSLAGSGKRCECGVVFYGKGYGAPVVGVRKSTDSKAR